MLSHQDLRIHQIKWSILFVAPDVPPEIANLIGEFVAPAEIQEEKVYEALLKNTEARLRWLKKLPQYCLFDFEVEHLKQTERKIFLWKKQIKQHGNLNFITFRYIPELINSMGIYIKLVDALILNSDMAPAKLNLTWPIEY